MKHDTLVCDYNQPYISVFICVTHYKQLIIMRAMKLFITLICLKYTYSEVVDPIAKENSKCEGVHVRGKFHRKHVMGIGLNRPYQLSTYGPEHKIFFSYNIGNDEQDTFKLGYIQHNHTGFREINQVPDGFATAVDEHDHVAYFGGSEGIYKYHLHKNESEIEQIVHNRNIWDLFFLKELYFIIYPQQHLYKYNTTNPNSKPERVKDIHEKIFQFVIDSEKDKFITNSTGLYMIKPGSNDRIRINGSTIFRAVEIDRKGEAYFCGKHDIHVVNKHNHTLEKIADIRNIFGITFDQHNNIIYANPHQIIKLLPEDC